jgi:hypothetical protein
LNGAVSKNHCLLFAGPRVRIRLPPAASPQLEPAAGTPACPWPADHVEHWPIERLISYANNPRLHSEADIANTFSDPADLKALIRAITRCREIGNSAAMSPFVKREVMPGDLSGRVFESFVRGSLLASELHGKDGPR